MATLGIPDLDPLTGLPKKKQAAFLSSGVDPAQQYNPVPSGINPSTGVPYGSTTQPGSTSGAASSGNNQNYFQSLLDSLLSGSKANVTAADTADIAGRNAAINRAVTQFGALPDTAAASQTLGLDLGSIISPDTAQLAQQNPFSTSKQIDQANTDAIRQLRRSLAARGGLQSGDLGYGLQKQQDAYSQAKYNASQQLLDYIAGVQQAYAAAEQQRQQALQAQQMDYAQLIASLFPQGVTPPTVADQPAQQQPASPPPANVSGVTPPGIPQSVSGYLPIMVPPKVSGTFDRVLPNAYNTNKNKRG